MKSIFNWVYFFVQLLLLTIYLRNFSEALNCKSFSPDEAKFAAEHFYQIRLFEDEKGVKNDESPKNPIKKESSAKIVANFVKSLRSKFSQTPNNNAAAAIDPKIIVNNARKMVTMATDLCNRLPNEHEHMAAIGYIHCVQFLLYQHMQKLVWRLQFKWGVQFNEHYAAQNEMAQNALLAIYTEKKMTAWEEMLKIYGKDLVDLTEKNEQIRRKFEFCLVIDGETQLKCDPISTKNAQIFIKFFHRNVYEPEFEQKRAIKAELIAINILNSLREERRKDAEREEEMDNEMAKIEAKNWKLAEPTLRVRVQVLVNMAQQKCRKLRKNPFNSIAKLGRSISARFERARSVKNANEQQSANATTTNNNNNECGGSSSSSSSSNAAADAENGLDEISSDFVTCVYHFMYAFSQNLIANVEAKHGGNFLDKKLKGIYAELREKTRKRLEMAFYEDDVQEMEKWLNGETASSDGVEDQAEEEVEDPFKNCANVQQGHTNGDEVSNGEGNEKMN
uniref:Uncharacterized protein n=1 Tax=Globodera rostochiensis TaxID=31243 RepID=A0A914IDA7_GLORO